MPSATSPLTRCNRSVLHLLLSWMIDVLLMLALKSVSLASKDVKDWTPFRSETRRSSLLVRKKSCFLSEMLVVYARFSLYTSCRYFWVLEILLQKLCVTRTCLRDGSYRLKEKKQRFVKSYVINGYENVKPFKSNYIRFIWAPRQGMKPTKEHTLRLERLQHKFSITKGVIRKRHK